MLGTKQKGIKKAPRFQFCALLIFLFIVCYAVLAIYHFFSLDLDASTENRFKTSFVVEHSRQGDIPAQTHKSATSSLEDTRKTTTSTFQHRMERAEEVLKRDGVMRIRKIISAFVEAPMNDTIPGTGSRGDPENEKDPGQPPEFVVPLPLRTTRPEDLKKYEYPRFQTCDDLPARLPVDRGLEIDPKTGEQVVWNVGDNEKPPDYPWLEAEYCPVDADPFLPWIHDMFPSIDGSKIEFIAQNKRRCDTGKKFAPELDRRQPQVAIMQPISVQRLSEKEARSLAPELWSPETDGEGETSSSMPRYRLAPFEESDNDAQYTRFICRFHGLDFSSGKAEPVVLGETLSVFPINYEYVSFRKLRPTMLTPKGKDTKFFWMSNFRFECPVPQDLQAHLVSGSSILSDGTPTLHVDLIPIRTSPRFGLADVYFTKDLAGPREGWRGRLENDWVAPGDEHGFDPKKRWGDRNVMPRVEAAGRWVNLPVCYPPKLEMDAPAEFESPKIGSQKPHQLSACVWASASFLTRGKAVHPITDTLSRLEEWIEFHLMVGFDHIYVYDNSGANTRETSLAPTLAKYPPSQVTRIDWPSISCNNNIPAHDSTGERSSQYAAENSCRARFGPFTEWIASFDTDEYLIPMGKYENLKDVVKDAAEQGTNILTFRSTRAKLMHSTSVDSSSQRIRNESLTFLEAYNCDSAPTPKPSWSDRARKQLYRPDYVLYHFVHYSTVTQGILKAYKDSPGSWGTRYRERPPSERNTDEANEAVMLHTKTTTHDQTNNWKKRCHYKFEKKWRGCYVGFPWPGGIEKKEEQFNHDEDGMEYNCFVNQKIADVWVPRLKEALLQRKTLPSSETGVRER